MRYSVALLLLTACSHSRSREGLPPLHAAAALGDERAVARLIDAGESPLELEPTMALSPLHKAAYAGNSNVARLLVRHGAPIDLSSPSNGNTALHDAIYFRNGGPLTFIATMLELGASLAVRNRAGFTPLDAARLLRQEDTVALLESEAARRLPERERRLMEAVRANDESAVAAAIEHGVGVEFADPQGFTPLIWAAREGYDTIVGLLLERGSDPNQNDVWMRANAGHKAAFWGRASTLVLLTTHGLNVDAQGGYNGYTALHDAVAGRHYDAARVLIAAGAHTDIRGHDGKSAADLVAASGDAELANIVLGGAAHP